VHLGGDTIDAKLRPEVLFVGARIAGLTLVIPLEQIKISDRTSLVSQQVMSQNIPDAKPRPEVLIVGAGIAGLTLAILLEQINIPYQIFERAEEVKPLGM
ncbi:hypothetical protein BGX21_005810, partial [Mortierella sp. AD011]